jgi:hypothetical protein
MEESGQLKVPAALPPGKSPPPPGTDLIGGWLGSRDGLDAVLEKKNPFPASAKNRTPIVQPKVKSP